MGQGTHRNKFYTIDGVEFEGEDNAEFEKELNVEISDNSLQDVVYEMLLESLDIESGQIGVIVAKGIVTLEGQVISQDMKMHSEKIVRDIAGVRDVQNNLEVIKGFEKPVAKDILRDEELRRQT